MMFTVLHTLEDLDQALKRSAKEPVVLFKHSRMCGTSVAVRQRLLHLTEPGDPPVYEVVVQQSHLLAQHVAETLGIQHESPQVIVLHKKKAIYHASHSRVRPEAIRDAVASTTSDAR